MPAPRIDWQSIRDAFATERVLFCLPRRFQQLLLADIDRLTWRATYREHGYDYSDWNELQNVVETGTADLLGGIPLNEVLGRLDQIISLLSNADYCCTTTVQAEPIESDFENGIPGETTPPPVWGDAEPVTDTDDWQQLVCGAADAYVDLLKDMADTVGTLITIGALTIGAVAGVLALMSGAGLLAAVEFTTAAGALDALLAFAAGTAFTNAQAELEAARDDIRCAVIAGNLAATVEASINSTAWLGFFQFVDYTSARNVMLEGTNGSDFLDVNRTNECGGCETGVFNLTWGWDTQAEWSDVWSVDSPFGVWDDGEIKVTFTSFDQVIGSISRANLLAAAGLPDGPAKAYLVQYDDRIETGQTWGGRRVTLTIFYDDGTSDKIGPIVAEGDQTVQFVPQDKFLKSTGAAIQLVSDAAASGGSPHYMDNLVVQGEKL